MFHNELHLHKPSEAVPERIKRSILKEDGGHQLLVYVLIIVRHNEFTSYTIADWSRSPPADISECHWQETACTSVPAVRWQGAHCSYSRTESSPSFSDAPVETSVSEIALRGSIHNVLNLKIIMRIVNENIGEE